MPTHSDELTELLEENCFVVRGPNTYKVITLPLWVSQGFLCVADA
jgi:hypothetical protein